MSEQNRPRHYVAMAKSEGRTRTPEFDSATIRKIAVEASADPRTVVKHLLGVPVAGLCVERIDAALERLGLREPAQHQEQ